MKTLKSFFSIIAILASLSVFGQDTLPKRKIYIRPGIDLSRIVLPFIGDYSNIGFEASIDSEIKYKYFPIIEAGWNSISDNRDEYQYKANGYYGRIGLNYNMLKYRHRLDRNLFFVGGRFAYSNYKHQFDNVVVENEWGQITTGLPSTPLKAYWFEGVMGLKGEIVNNLFVGYTVRVKIMASRNEFQNFTPYFIPGFGDGSKTTTVGLSFTVAYAIPLNKITLE